MSFADFVAYNKMMKGQGQVSGNTTSQPLVQEKVNYCDFFGKTGSCKYGDKCKFKHEAGMTRNGPVTVTPQAGFPNAGTPAFTPTTPLWDYTSESGSDWMQVRIKLLKPEWELISSDMDNFAMVTCRKAIADRVNLICNMCAFNTDAAVNDLDTIISLLKRKGYEERDVFLSDFQRQQLQQMEAQKQIKAQQDMLELQTRTLQEMRDFMMNKENSSMMNDRIERPIAEVKKARNGLDKEVEMELGAGSLPSSA
eukprot:gene636-761_t